MTAKPQPMKHLKQHDSHKSIIAVGQDWIGGNEPIIIGGPCAVESYEQMDAVAQHLKSLGVNSLRGGAFKPRTSPYAFQGMGLEGLKILNKVAKAHKMAVITEVMSIDQIDVMAPYIDCYQVGARNMQNFDLLKALGAAEKPILLKRGLSATLDEFLMAAEYIMAHGNSQVILCERGIRSFDNATRNVLDLAAVAWLKDKTHLPVIVDPSHATGVRALVTPTARAAIAVGADGLIVETHPVPHQSVSDAAQALSFEEFSTLVQQCRVMADAMRQVNHHSEMPVLEVKAPRPLRVVYG